MLFTSKIIIKDIYSLGFQAKYSNAAKNKSCQSGSPYAKTIICFSFTSHFQERIPAISLMNLFLIVL